MEKRLLGRNEGGPQVFRGASETCRRKIMNNQFFFVQNKIVLTNSIPLCWASPMRLFLGWGAPDFPLTVCTLAIPGDNDAEEDDREEEGADVLGVDLLAAFLATGFLSAGFFLVFFPETRGTTAALGSGFTSIFKLSLFVT